MEKGLVGERKALRGDVPLGGRSGGNRLTTIPSPGASRHGGRFKKKDAKEEKGIEKKMPPTGELKNLKLSRDSHPGLRPCKVGGEWWDKNEKKGEGREENKAPIITNPPKSPLNQVFTKEKAGESKTEREGANNGIVACTEDNNLTWRKFKGGMAVGKKEKGGPTLPFSP